MKHTILVILTAAALCAMSGCPNVMKGMVDDQQIGPARSAIFDTIDTGYPDVGVDGNLFWLVISGLSAADACDAMKDSLDIEGETCEDICEQTVEMAEQYFSQPEYWAIDLTLVPLSGEAVTVYEEGDGWDFLGEEPVFSGGISYIDSAEAKDVDACIEQCEEMEGDSDDWWEADGGSVEVTEYTEEESMAGDFDVDFDGDPVTGSFQAAFCDFTDSLSPW